VPAVAAELFWDCPSAAVGAVVRATAADLSWDCHSAAGGAVVVPTAARMTAGPTVVLLFIFSASIFSRVLIKLK
jgi:hypothetical protein